MADKKPLPQRSMPQPADVPALNAQIATEPLRVGVDVAQEGTDYSVGTVTEFVAQGAEVLARVRFYDRPTVKAPVSLLRDADGNLIFSNPADTTETTDVVSPANQTAESPTSPGQDASSQDAALSAPPPAAQQPANQPEAAKSEEPVKIQQTKAVSGPSNNTSASGPADNAAVPAPQRNGAVEAAPENKAVPGPEQAK